MHQKSYDETETEETIFFVFGFDSNDRKMILSSNGYNPYTWDYEGYRYPVRLEDLDWAKHEADHAPKNLKNITIQKVNIRKQISTTTEKETIEYEPKGLDPIIPF